MTHVPLDHGDSSDLSCNHSGEDMPHGDTPKGQPEVVLVIYTQSHKLLKHLALRIGVMNLPFSYQSIWLLKQDMHKSEALWSNESIGYGACWHLLLLNMWIEWLSTDVLSEVMGALVIQNHFWFDGDLTWMQPDSGFVETVFNHTPYRDVHPSRELISYNPFRYLARYRHTLSIQTRVATHRTS